MNTVQSTLSSPRNQRIIFWLGVLVLAAGVGMLVVKFVGGSGSTSTAPTPGFKPVLPKNAPALTTAAGVPITKYSQLDQEIKSTIRTFIATAVARKNLDKSWSVIAPSLRKGYTYAQWTSAKALPIIPVPGAYVDQAMYNLEYATTQEIMLEVGVDGPRKFVARPATFWLALAPYGKGNDRRWLVSYWMPRYTAPVPIN
jgi:hypothetical protein